MTEKTTSGGGMIPVETWEKIVSAFSGSGGGLVPLPHIHEIFLIDCRIAGTTHVEGIDDKTALRKAHLTRNLLRALGEGKVTFSYRKQDGSLRTAHGTLRHGICREYDAYHYTSQVSEDEEKEWPYSHFTYWDLDCQCFRSFRAEDLEDYQKMEVEPQT